MLWEQTNWLEFDCTGGNLLKAKISEGAWSEPVKTNKMTLKEVVKYKATEGIQEPGTAECCGTWKMEADIYNGAEELIATEITGMTAKFIQVYEEKWEIRTIA
jgi:hypothetical protein